MKNRIIAVKPKQIEKKGSAEYLAEALMSGFTIEVYIHIDK